MDNVSDLNGQYDFDFMEYLDEEHRASEDLP